jgi:hypothetical protein
MLKKLGATAYTLGSTLATFGILLPLSAVQATAQETNLQSFPLAIICEFSGIPHVFYLSKLQKDGVAVYLRPDGIVGMITLTGTATVVGGDEEGGSCGGKTLEEIRAAGQTVEFAK